MSNSTPNNDLKYQIDEKLRVHVRLLPKHNPFNTLNTYELAVRHDSLSAQDIAALLAHIAAQGFNQKWNGQKITAMLSKLLFDGTGLPVSPGPIYPETEFIIAIHAELDSVKVGDRIVTMPRLRAVAYRPVEEEFGRELYTPGPHLLSTQCRGVLDLSIWQGMLVVNEHRGWLGSNAVVAWLQEQFDAAIR